MSEQTNDWGEILLMTPGVPDPLNKKPEPKAALTDFRRRHTKDEGCKDDKQFQHQNQIYSK